MTLRQEGVMNVCLEAERVSRSGLVPLFNPHTPSTPTPLRVTHTKLYIPDLSYLSSIYQPLTLRAGLEPVFCILMQEMVENNVNDFV